MTKSPRPDGRTSSPKAIEALELLAAALRAGAHEVRSFALMPLSDVALRMDLVRNPRLADRINKRMFGGGKWNLPSHIEDFPQLDSLIALLRHGPSRVFHGLGFAWHGNVVARSLLSGNRELGARLGADDLKRVLSLRALGSEANANQVPSDAEIDQDGALCLWCWMAALPQRIQPLGLAVLLKDCCAHAEYSSLSQDEQKRRAALADAWLKLALSEVRSAA